MIGAVDIGGTKIAVAIVDREGILQERTELATADCAPPGAANQIADLLERLGQRQKFEGIGIGCTGPIDPVLGVIGDVDLLPGWKGLQLVAELSSRMGVPVAMENDADAAALAEAQHTGWGDTGRFLYVSIGTGIGAGIVLDGKLYRGTGGSHPELGHHTVDASGPICYCGATGCWESLASGPALAAWVLENAQRGDGIPSQLNGRDVFSLARDGNPLCLRAVERFARYLGLGLANLATFFCPDHLAVGGGVMDSADFFWEQAINVVDSQCGLIPRDRIMIAPAALGRNVALLGAAQVWRHRYE